jgi:THO complex subunit 4
MDVAETEVEELFKRTVGPVKDMFIIYNNQARSKGMAIVTFHRPADAGVARSKYNGKVIDGKHKLKIELVTDNDELSPETTKEQPNTPPSLLSRIAGPRIQVASVQAPNNAATTQPPQHPAKRKSAIPIVVSAPRKRTKKGPKRVKKSLAQLDQEMEEYRASVTDGNNA